LDQIAIGELLQFFGILLLITRFKFGSRRELWNTTTKNRFVPCPKFGETTGMSRNRFEEIWMNLQFSEQPKEREPTMSTHKFRWKLVDDFVEDFNEHRRQGFRPSELVSIGLVITTTNHYYHRSASTSL
jgi:hypothetical protein